MLKEFQIGCYRGIKNLILNDFGKINVLVGPNNCGKTSILEAIILSGLFDDLDLLVEILVSRYHGFSPEYFESIFPIDKREESDSVICLKSKLEGSDETLHTHLGYKKQRKISKDEGMDTSYSFELSFLCEYYKEYKAQERQNRFAVRFEEDDDGYKVGVWKDEKNTLDFRIPCKYVSFSRFDSTKRLINDIDDILDQNLRNELIDILKIFDQDIINFEIVGRGRTIKIFKKDMNSPLMLYDYGNGLYKAFFIAAASLMSKNGILLIDEIEAGIHSRALADFVEKLLEVCNKNNVQLFLSTYSLEAIDIILEDCKNELDSTSVYHIKNKQNETFARRYSGNKLMNLRNEIGFDVR